MCVILCQNHGYRRYRFSLYYLLDGAGAMFCLSVYLFLPILQWVGNGRGTGGKRIVAQAKCIMVLLSCINYGANLKYKQRFRFLF